MAVRFIAPEIFPDFTASKKQPGVLFNFTPVYLLFTFVHNITKTDESKPGCHR